MGWESETSEFYRNARKEDFFMWVTREDAMLDFSTFVIADLEDVKADLKPFVKRVNLNPDYGDRVFSAILSFEEKGIGKSAFKVEAELNNSYIRISTYHDASDRSYFLRLDSDRFLKRGVITKEFMVFWSSRIRHIYCGLFKLNWRAVTI